MDLTEQTLDLGIHQPGAPGDGLLRLFEDSRHTDVTFLVSGQVLVKAHRVILASQSEYFECLLYGPMKEGRASKITLQDTPAEAFTELMKFVYSGSVGSLNMMTTLELMTLADRFGFSYLKDEIEEGLVPLISVHNVLQFHSHAQVSSASRLQEKCEIFIDSNATAVINSPTLVLLPKKNLKGLISRDSFIVEEIRVFRAVQKWMDSNRVGKKEASELLECVRLTEISREQLEEEVRPSGLYDDDRVVKTIGAKEGGTLHGLSPRGKKGEDLNLFTVSSTKLLTCTNYMLHVRPEKRDKWSCVSDFLFQLVLPAAREPGCITVQFDSIYIINQITFVGTPGPDDDDSDHRPFCYQVWMSQDESNWATVFDYANLRCYSTQRLFFPKKAVRFVRILQTRGHEMFTIHLLNCGYVGPVPYTTRKSGVIAPLIPLTPTFSQFVRTTDRGLRCFVTFTQPYSISKLRLRLKGLQGFGNVSVCVSTQNRTKLYQPVGMFKDFDLRSMLETRFVERIVSIVSVTITQITLTEGTSPRFLSQITVEDLVCQAEH